jgi:hypothetical protein
MKVKICFNFIRVTVLKNILGEIKKCNSRILNNLICKKENKKFIEHDNRISVIKSFY